MRIITLPCRLSDSLHWDHLLQNISPSDEIFWKFDLGLNTPYFPLEDDVLFKGLKLALNHFTATLWPKFQTQTKGGALYEGSLDFSQWFSWSGKQEENFEVWKSSRSRISLDLQKKFFCANAFLHYGQMLAHSLPDEMTLYWFLDAEGAGSLAEMWQIISKERFEYFGLAVRNLPFWDQLSWDETSIFSIQNQSRKAVCFPEEALCSTETLLELEEILEESQGDMKVVFEPFLTESWEGLDEIYITPEAMSPRGERKLMGFRATGGVVVEKVIRDRGI